MDFSKQIDNGIRLLDEHKPGWYNDVDLETLELNNCMHCVLGQLYGDEMDSVCVSAFDAGCHILHLNEEESAIHGFDLPWEVEMDDSFYDQRMQHWQRLTDQWKSAIRSLRAADAQSGTVECAKVVEEVVNV